MSNHQWLELKLPDIETLKRLILYGSFRLGLTLFKVHFYGIKQLFKLCYFCAEAVEQAIDRYCQIVDASVWGGIPQQYLDVKSERLLSSSIEPSTDLLKLLEGKHALIVGGTGSGKTTLARYLAAVIGGQVKVYDPDAAPEEWLGCECIGREGDFAAIETAMSADLEDLKLRLQERGKRGDTAFIGRETFTIAEELPLLKDEVDSAVEWMLAHARRGRKPKRFICILSQESEVKALGLEGQGGARKNLVEILTNKEAIGRAKKQKNTSLVEWLQKDHSRVLADGEPVQLLPIEEIERVIRQAASNQVVVTNQFNPEHETGIEVSVEPLPAEETSSFDYPEIAVLEGVLEGLSQGRSDDWIAKHVIMKQYSIGYYKAKNLAAKMRLRCLE